VSLYGLGSALVGGAFLYAFHQLVWTQVFSALPF